MMLVWECFRPRRVGNWEVRMMKSRPLTRILSAADPFDKLRAGAAATTILRQGDSKPGMLASGSEISSCGPRFLGDSQSQEVLRRKSASGARQSRCDVGAG